MPRAIDIVAFSPHPDDAEIGCAGLLLLAAREGLSTAIVDLSEGEKSSRGTEAIRRDEKALAGKRLGLSVRLGLGLPDTRIGASSEHEAEVISCLRNLRPRLVLCPFHEDRHPDHVETARLVKRAVFLAGVGKVGAGKPHKIDRLLHYCIHQPFAPSLVVDVTAVWPDCQSVLAAYKSQFSPAADTGQAASALSDGGFLEALEARSRHYGAMINVERGEAYFSAAPLSVASPSQLLSVAAGKTPYGSFF